MKKPHNIRKIPEYILSFIGEANSKDFVVYTEKVFSKAEIKNGIHSNIGLSFDRGKILTKSFTPQKKTGHYCKYNQTVRIVVHKEQPKQIGYRYLCVPNFGDYTKGTHEIEIPYEHYPRDYIHPCFTEIKVETISEENDSIYIRFFSSEILNKDDKNFQYRLFSNLNMFQELFGSFKVKESERPYPAYIKEIVVNWEFLPEGERLESIKKFVNSNPRNNSLDSQKEIIERFAFLEKFHPIAVVKGTSGFQRYIGYQFKNDLVVFENLRYGNAVYIMFDSWEELSKRSRIDLLTGKFGKDFERIVHDKRCKLRLKYCLKRHGITI